MRGATRQSHMSPRMRRLLVYLQNTWPHFAVNMRTTGRDRQIVPIVHKSLHQALIEVGAASYTIAVGMVDSLAQCRRAV